MVELDRYEMSSRFHKYRLEYSNQRIDGAYIRFERQSTSVDKNDYNKTILSDEWISSGVSVCNGKYDADASRCSLLAPFDNPMYIGMNILVGGMECGYNVDASDYDIFDQGVEMEISNIVVSALQFDECSS